MPRIQWAALPANVREHLLDRVRMRAINAQDLAALLAWINTRPELPEGAWCKDFGIFKLVGQARYLAPSQQGSAVFRGAGMRDAEDKTG